MYRPNIVGYIGNGRQLGLSLPDATRIRTLYRSRFVLRDEGPWRYSPTTHINRKGPAFLTPRCWPKWVWKECACFESQHEMFGR